MKPEFLTWLIYGLLVVAIAGIATITYQQNQIRHLQGEVESNRESIRSAEEMASTAMSEITGQQERIASLERSVVSGSNAAALIPAADVRDLPPGIFVLTTATSYGPGAKAGEEIQISHAVFKLSDWTLNVGLARSGLMPIGVYFDYNGDGRTDITLAVRFVREIPFFGNSIADRLIADKTLSQNLYSVFVSEWESAEFTPAEELAGEVESASSSVWTMLESQAEEIVGWIEEAEAQKVDQENY